MFGFAGISLAILALAQAEQSPSFGASVTVFKAACLDTDGDREALRKLASAKGWATLDFETPPSMDWAEAYESGAGVVRLSHAPFWEEGDAFRPEQLICGVDRIDAGANWIESVSAIEVDGEPLGAPSEVSERYDLPAGVEVEAWELADGGRLHSTYIAAERRLEISINYPSGF